MSSPTPSFEIGPIRFDLVFVIERTEISPLVGNPFTSLEAQVQYQTCQYDSAQHGNDGPVIRGACRNNISKISGSQRTDQSPKNANSPFSDGLRGSRILLQGGVYQY
jgi:hypothetical protein